jgi:hypothetical protein
LAYLVSFECHSIYFILYRTKPISITTWKLFPWLRLFIRVVFIIFISITDISITTIIGVWWINNTKVITTGKYWTTRWLIIDSLLFFCVFKFVHISQWEQKGTAITITSITTSRLPFAFSITTNDLIIISFNQSDGVLYSIAFFMELECREIMLASLKQKFKLLNFQGLAQSKQMLAVLFSL